MSLELNAEEEQIVAATGELLRARLPARRLRGLGGASAIATPRALWEEIAALGWFGLGLPEAQGGAGYSIAQEALVALELGRQLAPPSILATLLAARLAADAGRTQLVAQFVSGAARAGFAVQMPADEHERQGATRRLLLDAEGTTHVLQLSADTAALLALPASGPGQVRVACLDESVPMHTCADQLPAAAPIVPAHPAFFSAAAQLLVGATLCGMAQAAAQMAANYAKERQQFGRAIGAFQATKHRCARMALRAEAASSHCRYAATTLAQNAAGCELAAAQTYWLAVAAAENNAADNVQVHGGMGFTVEVEAHVLVKRTWLLRQLLQPTEHIRALILRALVGEPTRPSL